MRYLWVSFGACAEAAIIPAALTPLRGLRSPWALFSDGHSMRCVSRARAAEPSNESVGYEFLICSQSFRLVFIIVGTDETQVDLVAFKWKIS